MLYGEGEMSNSRKIIKSLDIMPIAGWLADKNGRTLPEEAEVPRLQSREKVREIRPAVGLEEEEAEALEELLKEFLSLT